MIRYVIKRLLMVIPVVLVVSIAIFTIMYFTPGEPARVILGDSATDAEIAQLTEEMGLNDPYIVQLGRFMYDMFIKFDLGNSYITGNSVWEEIVTRFPRTLVFAVGSMILQVVIGTPLGITAATHQNGFADRFCMLVALVGISLPNFWIALQLVLLFSLTLKWLPAYGLDAGLASWVLPLFTNSLAGIAMQARQTRSQMLENIRADYVTTARASGLSERSILYKYALPNSLIPVLQTMGDTFGRSLGGTVVIENVFSIPGIGTYLTGGISSRDYPVIRGSVVMLAIAFSLIMLIVDLGFAFIDPRIKAQYERQNKELKLPKWLQGRRKVDA